MIDSSLVREKAFQLGFDSIGFLSIDDYNRLSGNTRAINRVGGEADSSPQEIFPSTKSIISLAFSYDYQFNRVDSTCDGYIAHYTTANFYKHIRKRVKELADFIYDISGVKEGKRHYYFISINSRLNDKLIARLAGVGCTLANSLVATREAGCKVLLGNILLAEDIDPSTVSDTHSVECGCCGICERRCPTSALSRDGRVDKSKCLHHLSSEVHWSNSTFTDYIKPYWGTRFFGCTTCVDCCPTNAGRVAKIVEPTQIEGFIGTVYVADDILHLSKGDFKKRFTNNQLSAGWIPEIALVRNALLMLYNLGEYGKMGRFVGSMKERGFSDEEIEVIHKLLSYLDYEIS